MMDGYFFIAEWVLLSYFSSRTAAFVLSVLLKWRVDEWVQTHVSMRLLRQLSKCIFCMSWWFNFMICFMYAAITGHWLAIVAAIFATPKTRILI